jgi:hypothetical protein
MRMDLPKSPAPQAGLYADESRPCVTCSSAAQREMELDERSRFASADDDLGSCTAITSKVTAKAYSALRLNTTSRGSLQSASRTRTFRPERHPGSRSGIVSTAGGWGVKSYLSGSVRLIARPQGIGKPARSLALPPSSRSATSSFLLLPTRFVAPERHLRCKMPAHSKPDGLFCGQRRAKRSGPPQNRESACL